MRAFGVSVLGCDSVGDCDEAVVGPAGNGAGVIHAPAASLMCTPPRPFRAVSINGQGVPAGLGGRPLLML